MRSIFGWRWMWRRSIGRGKSMRSGSCWLARPGSSRSFIWGMMCSSCLRDQAGVSEFLEEVEEAFVGGLIRGEAELATFGYVGDNFDRPAEVGVGMPGRG